MGLFERYLSLWVALCIAAGVALGVAFPQVFEALAQFEFASVNLVVAVLVWAMIFPMMTAIDLSSLRAATKQPRGLVLTLVVNWLIKPFTMFALGYLFFRGLFSNLVSADDASQYIAGMILLGVAPCTAMVFVWSQLTRGDASYTLLQVSVNDVILIFAFAPIAGFLLGITDLTVPWDTLLLSVVLYVVLPLLAGVLARRWLLKRGGLQALEKFQHGVKPLATGGLCLTVLMLFAFQAQSLISQPFVIVLIAIPLIIQTYLIFGIGYVGSYLLRLPHRVAAPACLIGTSNFFELAVAVAISVFGLTSGAALATVVGVLVEVPVMLSLVYLMNKLAPATDRRAHQQEGK
ncbi:arsenical-resistance protein [Aliidiomarina sedimenti]|uniref:Arsenical-resistance protein n=1 Tax=Aliidiomarina sedimenti TaxID=1933879 RepID=A0ABY0BZB4_9GAMM|nr:ACR3 family arsenite efflux transporter [Aliidiomarina sedimenti]RUO29973.1 arsenical-resistance protein [Aliidiomarina sedimenti]